MEVIAFLAIRPDNMCVCSGVACDVCFECRTWYTCVDRRRLTARVDGMKTRAHTHVFSLVSGVARSMLILKTHTKASRAVSSEARMKCTRWESLDHVPERSRTTTISLVDTWTNLGSGFDVR
ncbi:unnamed protein product [Ectocarpus sp. 8 AP-2014]